MRLLLIQRGRDPFKEHWALPGGFVDADEDIDVAAARELAEETSLHDIKLDQWRAYGTPQRDLNPRHYRRIFWDVYLEFAKCQCR